MKLKNDLVEASFHPVLTSFLLQEVDPLYRYWKDELVITSGSEQSSAHSKASLHYATPAQAVDVRTWSYESHKRGNVPSPEIQAEKLKKVAKSFCLYTQIPVDWIEIILESNHIHIEYQPKRIEK